MLTLVLIAFGLSACAVSQPRPPLQAPDAWQLVRSGYEAFDRGELNRAEREFKRALATKPGFAPALTGTALVEGTRRSYEKAYILLSQANETVRTAEERMFLNLTWLRLYELQLHESSLREPERQQIIEDARISFRAAKRIRPGSIEANYRMGQVYQAALEFEKASDLFYRVLGERGTIGANARHAWELLQRIRKLDPRASIARRIALSERLTWGDAAALLTEELGLPGRMARLGRGGHPGFKTPKEYALLSSKATAQNSNDLSHPLRTIAHMGIRGLEPPGVLDAARPMTRGVFALILEDVLIRLAGDERLQARFIGRPSRFSDVRPDHYAYNAIMVATTLKFLSATRPNEFGLLEPVSGIEALAALQRLKGMLRLS